MPRGRAGARGGRLGRWRLAVRRGTAHRLWAPRRGHLSVATPDGASEGTAPACTSRASQDSPCVSPTPSHGKGCVRSVKGQPRPVHRHPDTGITVPYLGRNCGIEREALRYGPTPPATAHLAGGGHDGRGAQCHSGHGLVLQVFERHVPEVRERDVVHLCCHAAGQRWPRAMESHSAGAAQVCASALIRQPAVDRGATDVDGVVPAQATGTLSLPSPGHCQVGLMCSCLCLRSAGLRLPLHLLEEGNEEVPAQSPGLLVHGQLLRARGGQGQVDCTLHGCPTKGMQREHQLRSLIPNTLPAIDRLPARLTLAAWSSPAGALGSSPWA